MGRDERRDHREVRRRCITCLKKAAVALHDDMVVTRRRSMYICTQPKPGSRVIRRPDLERLMGITSMHVNSDEGSMLTGSGQSVL